MGVTHDSAGHHSNNLPGLRKTNYQLDGFRPGLPTRHQSPVVVGLPSAGVLAPRLTPERMRDLALVGTHRSPHENSCGFARELVHTRELGSVESSTLVKQSSQNVSSGKC